MSNRGLEVAAAMTERQGECLLISIRKSELTVVKVPDPVVRASRPAARQPM